MRFAITMGFVVVLGATLSPAAEKTPESDMYPDIQNYIEQRVDEFDQIPSERKSQLKKMALYVKSRLKAGEPARLTFICTHNSRRSHLSQIWAATAAHYYK